MVAGSAGTGRQLYYTKDHLGSVLSVLDTNGALVSRNRYDAWGNPVAVPQGAAGVLPLAFGGQYYHATSGLYLAEFRAYDSSAGRWLSRDPLEERGGINLYLYAEGNPVGDADPFGLAVTITITRDTYTTASVTGNVSVTSDVANAGKFTGFSLETTTAGPNSDKDPIPPGSYSAFIRTDHSPHRIELKGTAPDYTNVQIHPGNFPKDVKACFAVGKTRAANQVLDSGAAMKSILDVITNDASSDITVVIVGPSTAPAPLP